MRALLVSLVLFAASCSAHDSVDAVPVPPEDTRPEAAIPDAVTPIDTTADIGTDSTPPDVAIDTAPGAEVDVAVDTAEPMRGYCAGACRDDGDCYTGSVCRYLAQQYGSLTCRPANYEAPPLEEFPGPYNGACLTDKHCGTRQTCSFGREHGRVCVPGCGSDDECAARPAVGSVPFSECVDGQCERGKEGDVCGNPDLNPPSTWVPFAVNQRAFGECIPTCSADEQCPGGFCAER